MIYGFEKLAYKRYDAYYIYVTRTLPISMLDKHNTLTPASMHSDITSFMISEIFRW